MSGYNPTRDIMKSEAYTYDSIYATATAPNACGCKSIVLLTHIP